jgi:hypothetical protein
MDMHCSSLFVMDNFQWKSKGLSLQLCLTVVKPQSISTSSSFELYQELNTKRQLFLRATLLRVLFDRLSLSTDSFCGWGYCLDWEDACTVWFRTSSRSFKRKLIRFRRFWMVNVQRVVALQLDCLITWSPLSDALSHSRCCQLNNNK